MNMENVVWIKVEQAKDFFVFLPPPTLPTVLEIFYIIDPVYNIFSTTGPLRQFC